jgi:hypothetical protein
VRGVPLRADLRVALFGDLDDELREDLLQELPG